MWNLFVYFVRTMIGCDGDMAAPDCSGKPTFAKGLAGEAHFKGGLGMESGRNYALKMKY